MKITIETPQPGQEDEIIVRCSNLDERMLKIISSLKSENSKLTAYVEDKIVKLDPKDIYYFESVDNKVFAYGNKGVYEVQMKLYEIMEAYSYTDFLRISKSVIVNVAKIAYLRPGFTIECGRGVNPLPISQFGEIYEANRGILTLSLLLG